MTIRSVVILSIAEVVSEIWEVRFVRMAASPPAPESDLFLFPKERLIPAPVLEEEE